MALQEVLNSSIWVIKDDKSNYQPLYGQFLYTLNTNASGDDDNGVLYVGNGTEWINVMGTALQGVIENILATVPFEQIDNKTIFDAINDKANKATTLEGYGIEDAYTKTTIDAIILALEAELAGKQDKLTAGTNITIKGNTISAKDTTYTAGANVSISDDNAISVTGVYTSEQVDEKLATKADTSSLDGKQDKLTAGANIAISDTNEISVTGLTKDSVGLGNVDNTSDANKPISSATQEALDLKADKSQVANISTDGNTTKIEGNLEVSEVDTGEGGSIMTGTLVAHGQIDADSISIGMSSPLDSVATHISSDSKDTEIPTAKATYTFTKSAVSSLETIVADKQNKTDNSLTTTSKTIVGAINEVAGDLAGKQDKLTAGTNITISDANEISVTGLTKASVGLDNVDNTSDADKPISTATQEALDTKQNKLTAGDGIVIDETTNTISATGTGSGTVKSVNSVEPDDNGNVAITTANIPNLGISEDGKTITIGDKSIEPLTADSTIAAGKIDGVVAEATKATQDGNGDVISTTYAKATDLANKQDKLTAGTNITIKGNTISATDTTYTAGANVSISNTNVISATDTTYTAGTNVSISDSNVISATDTKYTAGANIAISAANEISVTGLTKASVGLDKVDNTSDADKPISSATQTALDLKADKTQVANISTNETVTTVSGSLHVEELDTGETGSISTGTLVAHGQVDVSSITVGASGVINSIATSVSASSTDTEIPTAKATYTFTKNAVDSLETIVAGKQDKLTAGDNVTITNNTISATDTKYTAGANVAISATNVISATDTKYTAGTGINISDDNVITATGGVAGTVTSVNNITPDDGGNVSLGVANIPGAYSETQATTDLATKQDKSFNIGEQAYTVEGLLTEQKSALDQTYIEKANNGIVIKGQVVIPLTADSEIPATKITGLTKSSVGLDNVDNTSDADKPISSATQAALNGKQDKLTAGANITISDANEISATDTKYTAGTNVSISATNVISATDTTYTAGTNIAISESNEISVTGLNKASVGLNNVDNTSDADKPVSDATQTALDTKQDVANLVTTFGVTPSDKKYPSEKLVNDALNQTNQRVTGVENDTQALSTSKQDKLTAGTNITISGATINAKDTTYTAGANIAIGDDNAISVIGVYTSEQVDEKLATKADASSLSEKQDKLTAGANITISDTNEISATDTKYTAGTGINISDDNVITATGGVKGTVTSVNNRTPDDGGNVSLGVANIPGAYSETQATTDLATKQDKLVAGANITISASNVISATDTKYTAGANVAISDANEISVTGVYTSSQVDEKLADKADVSSLDDKQDKLTAGANITISDTNEISATDTKYTAGTNITISDANAISVTGLTKASVGLGDVDNTSDENKPISTATQTALDAKQDIANLVTEFGETTSDTKYPSEKLVYSKLSQLVIDFNRQFGSKADVNANNITETYIPSWKTKLGISDLETSIAGKQDKLTAGTNITITGSTISSKDTTYTAGDNIAISNANAISVTGVYTSEEIDGLLADKADKTAVDNITTALNSKADKATTLEGYEITDAKIANGTIILGENSITPLTSASEIPVEKITGLTKASVGLGNVDNTSDADKPISDATQAALDKKQNSLTAGANITITGSTISSKDTTYTAGSNIAISTANVISATDTTYTAGTNIAISDANVISVTGLTKASVGLGNVNNTSDADKPISDATQTALDAKQDVTNLVTAFSETPADTKYPSEKLVYDSIENVHNTVDGELATKANEDATNITGNNVTKWKEALEIDVLEADLDTKQNVAIDIVGITAKTVENALAELNTGLAGKQAIVKAGDNISIGSDKVTISVTGIVPEATKATQDGNGNTISSWYATTGDLESKQNKLTAGDNIDIDVATNTISVTGTVPSAQTAAFADQATADGNGNNIAETYATIGDVQSKQDFKLVTTIDSTSDDTHYPSAKAVYDYAQASVTSTVETTVTPTTAQTATAIADALAKKARVVVIPSLANAGAIYIKESDTYSSVNPIYPDPTNNVYEFTNMQNVKVFVDSVGDSVDLVIEYRG